MGLRYVFWTLCLTGTMFFAVTPLTAMQVQEWGEVSGEEWSAEFFPEDEDAHSVILFDVGKSYINKNLSIVFSRHKRIKILDPEQSDYMDIQLAVHEDRDFQDLKEIEAQTLNLAPDRSVSATEVGRREFFTEDSGDREITSFTFPAVEPGSIVEYSYEIHFGSLLAMPGWTFQHSSPILHSEYNVMVPDFLSYRSFSYGYETFEPMDEDHEIYKEMPKNLLAASGQNESSVYRTVLKNAPAVRSESHISSLDNYKNSVRYQLTGYRDTNNFFNSYMSTWDEIAEELMDSGSFGRAFSSRRAVRRAAEEETAGAETDLDKAKALYEYVASDIQWDENFRMIPSDRAHKIIDAQSGNSADKAITLISLMREAGLQADPFLISTRKNGWVDWSYPELNAFNHVQVLLTIDDSVYLLDPLHEIIPFGSQFPESLNGSGLLVHDDSSEILELNPGIESSSKTNALLELNPDGSVKSSVKTTYQGYDAIINRALAEDEDEQEYLGNTLLSDLPNPEITNTSIQNLEEPEEPFSVGVEMMNPQYASVVGDMIYLNPFIVERINSNPFSNPVRNYPVEFNYGTRSQYTATVMIPDEYEVLEVPENAVVKFSENAAFQIISQQNGNFIQLNVTQINNDPMIGEEKYDELRGYYASLVEVYNQQIVLQKNPEQPDGADSAGGPETQEN
ncbi:MAG: DUF3857 and transglutaminase domain-containing protein [Bacteroidota bacterium]